MSVTRKTRARSKSMVIGVSMVVGVGFLALVAVYLISGRGLGLWRFAHLSRALVDCRSVSSYSQGNFTSVVFLHHSTGRNLIEQGRVREILTGAGYHFWDHDYNWEGLVRPDGSAAG